VLVYLGYQPSNPPREVIILIRIKGQQGIRARGKGGKSIKKKNKIK